MPAKLKVLVGKPSASQPPGCKVVTHSTSGRLLIRLPMVRKAHGKVHVVAAQPRHDVSCAVAKSFVYGIILAIVWFAAPVVQMAGVLT